MGVVCSVGALNNHKNPLQVHSIQFLNFFSQLFLFFQGNVVVIFSGEVRWFLTTYFLCIAKFPRFFQQRVQLFLDLIEFADLLSPADLNICNRPTLMTGLLFFLLPIWQLFLIPHLFDLVQEIVVVGFQFYGCLEVSVIFGVEFVAVEEDLSNVSLYFSRMLVVILFNFLFDCMQVHGRQDYLEIVWDVKSFWIHRGSKRP